MRPGLLLILFILCIMRAGAQDTLRIYFETGKSKISDAQAMILNTISSRYDLADVDSILYAGMADSVGNLSANLKLSRKRAQATADYCSRFMKKNYTHRIAALGETSDHSTEQNRQVCIVFYTAPLKDSTRQMPEIPALPGSLCSYVDYELLHRSSLRLIVKNKVEYVRIEADPHYLKTYHEHYYATILKNGSVAIKKVKWAQDHSTLIPKKDFQRFKIFKTGKQPCEECGEDLVAQKRILYESPCLQVDRFLMDHLQVKVKLFDQSKVKIRARREYVYLEDKYLIGCSLEHELLWSVKKGRSNRRYYFASLPVYGFYLGNIVRVMDCCKSKPEPSECERGRISCGTSWASPDKGLMFFIEGGDHYRPDTHTPYLALGLSKSWESARVSLLAGTNPDLDIYGSLRYQYHYLSVPVLRLSSLSGWQTPGSIWPRYGLRLYAGTELNALKSTGSKSDLLEQNLHLGAALVNLRQKPIFYRLFIQAGIAYDYLQNHSTTAYFIAQAGIQFRLAGGGPGSGSGGQVDNSRMLH